MTFNLLLTDSFIWTMIFFALVVLALSSQHTITERVHYPVRGLIKAVPAFFLAGLSWHFNGPPLLTFAFLLCACGDFLLDVSKATYFWLFGVGAGVFAVALICLSFAYLERPLDSRPLLPLSLTNIVLSLFVCVWVLPNMSRSLRIPALAYLVVLVVSNVIASTSVVPVFLGSTLWLLSDLAIGVSKHIPGTPANGLTNLGLYEVGLYFIALGFLNPL